MAGWDRDRAKLSAFPREVDRAQEPDPGYGDGSTPRVGDGGCLLRGPV